MDGIPEKINAIWIHANLATMTGERPYGRIEDGALAVADGKIAWVGKMNRLPEDLKRKDATAHDVQGQWITPGFIDCHTHLVYGGNRANEF